MYIHFKKYHLFIIISLIFTIESFSQNLGEDKLGTWYIYTGSHKLSEKFSLATAAEYRTYKSVSNFQMLFLSSGGSYKINNNIAVGLNYGYLHWDKSFESVNIANSNEHRFNEQFVLISSIKKLSLNNRFRLEHRFIDNHSSKETQHRLRYRFKVKYPFDNWLFITCYDELMYNLDGFKFQQNRLYGALGINLSKNSNLQIGYLKWSFKSKAYDRLQIGLHIKTDWSKKTKA